MTHVMIDGQMDQLGFTMYPQNWWTSRSFVTLTPAERYVYLEAIFYMYANPRGLEADREFFGQFLRMEIPPEIWDKVTKLFTRVGDYLQSDTVKKRKSRADQSRINGQNGGRPEKPKNPENNPENNPKNPPSEIKGNRNEINTKGLSKPVGMVKGADSKPPDASPSPLWAVGTPSGSDITAAWKKYGDHLETILEKLDRPRMIKAWRNYWPYELKPEEWEKIDKFLAEAPEQYIRFGLDAIGESLRTADVKDFSEPVEFAECYLTEKTS
jgi:hypothetical protein